MTIEFNCTLLFNLNPHIYLHHPSHPLICHHFTVTKLNYFWSIYFILLLHRQNWSTNPLVFVICFLLLEQFLNHKKNLIFFVNYFINIYIYWFIFFALKFLYIIYNGIRHQNRVSVKIEIERSILALSGDKIVKTTLFKKYSIYYFAYHKLYHKKNIQDIFIVFVQ